MPQSEIDLDLFGFALLGTNAVENLQGELQALYAQGADQTDNDVSETLADTHEILERLEGNFAFFRAKSLGTSTLGRNSTN